MKPLLCLAACLWLWPHAALAQSTEAPKISLALNGGYQLTTHSFADGTVKRENAEDGRIDTAYDVKAGPSFNIGGGARLRHQFGVGVGVHRISVSSPSHVTGSIPHPFFFNRPRPLSADVTDLAREELAVHLQASITASVSRRVQVTVLGGPSWFRVKQEIVTDLLYADSYPYDEVAFRSAVTDTRNASKIGFNIGGDVAFFVSRQVGVGMSVQASGASVPLTSASGGTMNLRAGGVQIGGGLRFRL